MALTNGESNPSAPSTFQLLITVSCAPGANLWKVKPFSALNNGQLLGPSGPRLALTSCGELNPSEPFNGQLLGPSASCLALTYGESNPSAPFNGQLLGPSAPRQALTYGESNPLAPFNGQLLVQSAWRQTLFDGD